MEMTKDQELAKKHIDAWLLSDESEYILSGIGGAGKSWLVDLIISEMHILQRKGKLLNISTVTTAEVTATTNKAAGILTEGGTIQSRLKLRLAFDSKTGNKILVKSHGSQTIYNTLLIIDECSMIDTNLLKHIRGLTQDCKILYVGDHCQLLPIKESSSPVFDDIAIETVHLREPVRCKIPDIFALCTQLRESVETGVFKPIQPSENVQFVSGLVAQDLMKTLYHKDLEPDEVKTLTYTNVQAIGYDTYVRALLGQTDGWQVGDLVLINNAVKNGRKDELTRVGSSHIITDITAEMEYLGITYRMFSFGSFSVRVPVCWNTLTNKVKTLARQAQWKDWIDLKESFADVRAAYASTCHASQGSSYGTVFINLTELCKCPNPDTFARLIYVACSRAKYKIYFTGKLSPKYGG